MIRRMSGVHLLRLQEELSRPLSGFGGVPPHYQYCVIILIRLQRHVTVVSKLKKDLNCTRGLERRLLEFRALGRLRLYWKNFSRLPL